ASTDASGVDHYNVYRSTTSGFTPSSTNQIGTAPEATYTDVGVTAGTHFYKDVPADPPGNASAPSHRARRTGAGGPPPGAGRGGAWGLDEGSGTTTADQSGNHNNGTLSNATWSASGKFGKALSFNGTNSFVSVPDANSLDLTSGLTVEGWVKPDGSTGFRA